MISQYHGEGVARQAVMEADLPLATAVELLREADTLADLFRLADRARQAQADQAEAETALEDGADQLDPILLDQSTPR
jgi:phage gp36-like protein